MTGPRKDVYVVGFVFLVMVLVIGVAIYGKAKVRQIGTNSSLAGQGGGFSSKSEGTLTKITPELQSILDQKQANVQSPPKQPQPQAQHLVPMLLGKTYDEVIKALGQPNDTMATSSKVIAHSELVWTYNNQPSPGFTTKVHFEPYLDQGPADSHKRVHYVIAEMEQIPQGYGRPPDFSRAIRCDQLVPPTLLNKRPSAIYMISDFNKPNSIFVLWKSDGHTFGAGISDSSQQLYRKERYMGSDGVYHESTHLTSAGMHFAKCDRAWFFIEIDSQPELFNYSDHGFVVNAFSLGYRLHKFDK